MEGLTLKELTLVVKYIFRDTYGQVEINKYKKHVFEDRKSTESFIASFISGVVGHWVQFTICGVIIKDGNERSSFEKLLSCIEFCETAKRKS